MQTVRVAAQKPDCRAKGVRHVKALFTVAAVVYLFGAQPQKAWAGNPREDGAGVLIHPHPRYGPAGGGRVKHHATPFVFLRTFGPAGSDVTGVRIRTACGDHPVGIMFDRVVAGVRKEAAVEWVIETLPGRSIGDSYAVGKVRSKDGDRFWVLDRGCVRVGATKCQATVFVFTGRGGGDVMEYTIRSAEADLPVQLGIDIAEMGGLSPEQSQKLIDARVIPIGIAVFEFLQKVSDGFARPLWDDFEMRLAAMRARLEEQRKAREREERSRDPQSMGRPERPSRAEGGVFQGGYIPK
jgi:hypothetical protein